MRRLKNIIVVSGWLTLAPLAGCSSGESEREPDWDCDYYKHPYSCDEQTLDACTPDGRWLTIDCGSVGGTCREGEPVCSLLGAQCFGPEQGYTTYCLDQDNVVIYNLGACTLATCPAGQVCADEGSGQQRFNGRCVLDSMMPCDPATHPPRCGSETAIEICSHGLVAWSSCNRGEICYHAVCRSEEEEPCSADTFVDRCDGHDRISCGGEFTRRFPCEAGSTCLMIGNKATCVAYPPTPCDQATFQISCIQETLSLECIEGYETYNWCDQCLCIDSQCECRIVG